MIFTRWKMRLIWIAVTFIALAGIMNFPSSSVQAQTPARGSTQNPPRGAAPARGAVASNAPASANLSQLMKGILYPNSNVIFAAQSQNPADIKPAGDPSTATDPLA